jgi:pSer/pThr/pTyr-binding forkhead associated (FHA) protein
MGRWQLRFKGPIEGREVELYVYDTGELKVKTTQKDLESTSGSFEEGSNIFPHVSSPGDEIEIDGDDADHLIGELMQSGFQEAGAREIARHGRPPTQ